MMSVSAYTGPPPDLEPAPQQERDGGRIPDPASRPAGKPRRWHSGGAGACALLVGAVYALIGSRPLLDNSFLTHLATGREILRSGLPDRNPFLYSSSSFPVPSYWWSVTLGVVEKVAGGTGLRLLTALLAALLGVLLVRLASRAAADGDTPQRTLLAVLIPTVLASVCVMPFLNSRPQLPGFLLLALTVLVWNERRSSWLLVPVFAAWVNIHGTWLYGIAILGLFAVAELIEQRRLLWSRASALGAAVLGTVIGGALYPRPFEIMLLPTRQFGSETERAALRLYREWQPVPANDPLLWLLLGLGLVALYGAVRPDGEGRRRWASGISAVGLVLLGLSGYRLVPIAAIALVPIVSSSLSQLGTIDMIRGRAVTVVRVLGCVLLGAALANTLRGPAYDLSIYPVKLVDRMERAELIGGEIRSLTHDYVGNYLEWRLGTAANTFVDDRPGARTFLDYSKMLETKPGWQEALRAAAPDVIIWNAQYRELPRELRRSPDWVRARTIGDWQLFCRPELAERCRAI